MTAKGQGLIEYLILVCLISVATIAIVSVVGQNIRARYATISSALRGDKEAAKELNSPEASDFEMRGFDDYMESATTKKK
jgi:Flp pilus assembly pilin Flp